MLRLSNTSLHFNTETLYDNEYFTKLGQIVNVVCLLAISSWEISLVLIKRVNFKTKFEKFAHRQLQGNKQKYRSANELYDKMLIGPRRNHITTDYLTFLSKYNLHFYFSVHIKKELMNFSN